jgi:hypothetical protein
MRLDRGQIEVVDDEMAEVLRHKSGAERLAIANSLFVFARDVILTKLRQEHPDWDEGRILAETARRLSHGAI